MITVLSKSGDTDGMDYLWEVVHEPDAIANDAAQDADGDGLSNGDEYAHDTDPRDIDSDDSRSRQG